MIEQFRPSPLNPFVMEPAEIAYLRQIMISHMDSFTDKESIDQIIYEYGNKMREYKVLKLETELALLKNDSHNQCL